MQPQALTRVTGTVVGSQTINVEALPATDTKAARNAFSYVEVAVISDYTAMNGELVDVASSVLPVRCDTGSVPAKAVAGERVDWLVVPYSTVAKARGRLYNLVAHRFVAAVPESAETPLASASSF